MLRQLDFERDPSAVFEWVKFRSHLSRGVTVGTMLQDESMHFIRIGTFLERADNTARLLDVKFHALAGDYFGARAEPDEAPEVDFYHWSAILRSVSGFEIYRKVYRNVIVPEKVAELLILRPDMPRSLASCMNGVVDNLRLVANEQSAETQRRAGRLRSDLRIRPHRRDPGHRPARLPDAVPRPRQRHRRRHQPRLPGAGMTARLLNGWRAERAAAPEPARHSRGGSARRSRAQREGAHMSIHVALNHVTHYRYDRRVGLSPQVVRLRPAPHCRTPILSYSLRIEPAGHFINWQQDPFANYLARLVFPEPTTEFKVTVDLVAEMAVYNPFDFFLEASAQQFPFTYDDALREELAPYLVKLAGDADASRSSSPRWTAPSSARSTSWWPSTSACSATSAT